VIIKYSEDQEDLLKRVRLFVEENISEELVQQWCQAGGIPDSTLKAFYDSGLALIGAPESFGGTPVSLLTHVLMVEEMAHLTGALTPFIQMAYNILFLDGLGENKQLEHIKEMFVTEGTIGFSAAITEPSSGSDIFSMKTSVTKKNGSIYLNGAKTYVTNGEYAPYLLVIAKDCSNEEDSPTFSFWLVPRGLRGVNTFPIKKIGWDITPFAEVYFDDVELDQKFLVGSQGQGRDYLFRKFGIGRFLTCASSLGLARAAMEDAIKFAHKRMAFGHRIAEYQMIEQMLVEMEIKIVNMQNFLYSTVQDYDDKNSEASLNIFLMKRYIPEAAFEVADLAMKVFGGIGYTNLTRVSRIWRDCRGYQFAEGTEQVMVRNAIRPLVRKYLGAENDISKSDR
jgi:alkylation response protein AidB-like acyl-CoA dehydrogenase